MDENVRFKISKVAVLFIIVVLLTYMILGQKYKMFIPKFNTAEHYRVNKFFVSPNCTCSKRICHQLDISKVNQYLFPAIPTRPVSKECTQGQNHKLCPKKASFECVHYMKGSPIGRTGNLMFQVAALFGTATRHGYTAIVSPTNPLIQFFTLPNLSSMKPVNNFTFHESSPRIYDKKVDNLAHHNNWTLKGFYQSWRYFEGMEDMLRNVFKFKDHIVSNVSGFIDSVKEPHVHSVCIHVRRGDFAHNEAERTRGHVSAPLSYISSAVQYIRTKHKQVHFFVLSDDKSWCKRNLRFNNLTLSPYHSPGYDMALMAFCDHVIVTAGTFGWWGGWLSKGDVVYWTGYPRKGSSLANDTNLEDYYPNDWIGLP